MLTVCWAAKGGSGTTVYAGARAVSQIEPTLLVDLAGDLPAVLGLPDGDGPGVHDWLSTDASTDRLAHLEHAVTDDFALIAAGRVECPDGARWAQLADHLAADPRRVIVDAGTGPPPPALVSASDECLLVTRPCYIAVHRASVAAVDTTGVILVTEPARSLGPDDIARAVGAPIIASIPIDPMIARAVDSGLLVSRLPRSWRRQLRTAA